MWGIGRALLEAYKSINNKKMFIIDVSHYQGLINWREVTTNVPKIDGAILKCSEGATGRDRRFITNIDGCALNNIKWGAYHFATWNKKPVETDALEEARWFISTVKLAGRKPDLPLVLDIESNTSIPYTKQEMVAYVKTFTDEVKRQGYDVAIYASPGFLNSYLPTNHPFTNIKLWVADYTGAINPVPGWTKIWLHQYTQEGRVKGISGNVDLNRQP